jgi:hypothetical protein
VLESIEIRWFYKGQIPNKLYQLFSNSNLQTKPELRTDYYLLIENCDSLGIKLRNSRLEIKWLKKREHFDFSKKNIEGNQERWIRWEWNDTNSFNEILRFIQVNKDNPWVKIDKKRIQKKFSIFDNSLVEIPLENAHFDFSIELTQLKVYEHLWWSIGCDTFQNKNDVRFFIQLIEQYTDEQFRKSLKSDSSYGYPKWISKIVSQ